MDLLLYRAGKSAQECLQLVAPALIDDVRLLHVQVHSAASKAWAHLWRPPLSRLVHSRDSKRIRSYLPMRLES